jgi:hypothetical protein
MIFRPRLHLALGFRSLFATSLGRVDINAASSQLTASLRPQAFAASRRFIPHPSSQACFIPQPRSGTLSFRGLLSPRSHPSSSEGACPLAVGTPPLSARSNFRRSARAPRVMPLDFEAFICARPRSESPVIHLAPGRSPLRVFAPPGLLSLDVRSGLPGAFRSWRSPVLSDNPRAGSPLFALPSLRLNLGTCVLRSTRFAGAALSGPARLQRIVIARKWLIRLRMNRPARAFEPSPEIHSFESIPATRLSALPFQ